MKKKGRWIPVIGCLMLVLFLAGCGKTIDIQSTAEQEIPSQNQIVVGVSQLGSESMWRTANSASIQQALCKENGYFLLFNNARQKQENQIKAIRSYISQRVDYIVFSPIVEDGWETVLQEAKEADIGIAGGNGDGLIFKKGQIVKKVKEDKLLDELMAEIEKM